MGAVNRTKGSKYLFIILFLKKCSVRTIEHNYYLCETRLNGIHRGNDEIYSIYRSEKKTRWSLPSVYSDFLLSYLLMNMFDGNVVIKNIHQTRRFLTYLRRQYLIMKNYIVQDAYILAEYNGMLKSFEKKKTEGLKIKTESQFLQEINQFCGINNWHNTIKSGETMLDVLNEKSISFTAQISNLKLLNLYPAILTYLMNVKYTRYRKLDPMPEPFNYTLLPTKKRHNSDFAWSMPDLGYKNFHLELEKIPESIDSSFLNYDMQIEYLLSCLVEYPNSRSAWKTTNEIKKMIKKEQCKKKESAGTAILAINIEEHESKIAEYAMLGKYLENHNCNNAIYSLFRGFLLNCTAVYGDKEVSPCGIQSIIHFNKFTKLVDLAFVANGLKEVATILEGLSLKMYMAKANRISFLKDSIGYGLKNGNQTPYEVKHGHRMLKFESLDLDSGSIFNELTERIADTILTDLNLLEVRRLKKRNEVIVKRVLKPEFDTKIQPKNVINLITMLIKIENVLRSEFEIGMIYSPEELEFLLEKVKDTPMEKPIALAGLAGLDCEEIGGLTWQCVDLENQSICIMRKRSLTDRRGKTKKMKDIREVIIPYSLMDILIKDLEKQKSKEEPINGNDFVCREPNGSLPAPFEFNEKLQMIIQENILNKISFDGLINIYKESHKHSVWEW
jgi:hypothetical protein